MNIFELRTACCGYPRTSILTAVSSVLETDLTNGRERNDLAALVTAWLTDDQSADDAPPLTANQLIQIKEELVRRAH